MIVQVPKSRSGEEYEYYSCLGRHSKRNDCDMRSITFTRVEDLIQELYDRLALRPRQAEAMHALLKIELRKLTKDADEQCGMTEEHQRRLIEWWLYMHSDHADPARVLTEHKPRSTRPARPALTEPDPGPVLYGTGLSTEEGLWLRTGTAGNA